MHPFPGGLFKVFFVYLPCHKLKTMKKNLLFIALIVLCVSATAQSPARFNYQAVARDMNGDIIDNQPVSFRVSIRDLSPSGTILYSETHLVNTNTFGLVTLEIGGGSVVSGNFQTINWGSGAKYLDMELDASGGSSWVSMGSHQLLSVPYALYANQAVSGSTGPTGPTGPTGASGANVACGTSLNTNYSIRGAGSGTWECTDALQISSTGYVSVNTTPSSSYRFRVYGNSGFGSSPSSSYDFSVDGSAHFADYMAIGTTPSSSYTLRVYGNLAVGSSVSSSYDVDVDGDMRIQDALGIGTYPPSYGLVVGSSSNFYVPTSIGSSSGTSLVISSGTVYRLSSSIRYKVDVKPLVVDREKFLSLRPVSFRYRKEAGGNGELESGFIAEEVAKVIPELVIWEYQAKKDASGQDILNEYGFQQREKTGIIEGVKYEQICVYLFQIVAEQEKRIRALEDALLLKSDEASKH